MAKKAICEMRCSKLPFHPSLILAPVAVIFWVIALAGSGATHKQCTKMGGSTKGCAAQFGLVWATVFYELVAILALFGLLPTKFGPNVRIMFAALLTIPTTLFMHHAQNSVVVLESMGGGSGRAPSGPTGPTAMDTQKAIEAMMAAAGGTTGRRLMGNAEDEYRNAYRTAAAGSTLMIIINLVVIIYLLLEAEECCSAGGCTTAVVKQQGTNAAQPSAATPAKPTDEAAVPPV